MIKERYNSIREYRGENERRTSDMDGVSSCMSGVICFPEVEMSNRKTQPLVLYNMLSDFIFGPEKIMKK